MKNFNHKDSLICPHCLYEFGDSCEDFMLQGINKQIGRVESIECDNCSEMVDMCDNGDGTIRVSKSEVNDD